MNGTVSLLSTMSVGHRAGGVLLAGGDGLRMEGHLQRAEAKGWTGGSFSKRPVDGTKQILSSSASNNFWMFQGHWTAPAEVVSLPVSLNGIPWHEIAWRSKHPLSSGEDS